MLIWQLLHLLARLWLAINHLIDSDLRIGLAAPADDNLVCGHTVLLLMCSVHPHPRARFCFAQGKAPAESTNTIG